VESIESLGYSSQLPLALSTVLYCANESSRDHEFPISRANFISAPKTNVDWAPIGAAVAPLGVFVLLVVIPGLPHATILKFVRENWGGIASVWGLGVSIYVLFVAKGARKAAEEARSIEQVRTVLEELEAGAEKIGHLGLFAHGSNWDLVRLRAEEVMTSCRTIVARWGDDPVFRDSRNKLLMVATLMRSIIEEANKDTVDSGRVIEAQLNASEKLSAVVGRVYKEKELGGK
jgi:hypothetical protein